MCSELAYGAVGFTPDDTPDANPNAPRERVPADTDLVYDITVVDVEAHKDPWKMTAEEKMEEAEALKANGNAAFRAGDWTDAETLYREASKMLGGVLSLDAEVRALPRVHRVAPRVASPPPVVTTVCPQVTQAADHARAPVLVNLAAALLKLKQYRACIASTTEALAIGPPNAKAFFRRGLANDAIGFLDEAVADVTSARTHAPTDAAIRKKLAELKRKKQRLEAVRGARCGCEGRRCSSSVPHH